jgi:DNA-binding NtrC family response regulator
MNVLLIDDDVNLSKVISTQLKNSGFEVSVANSGNDGFARFKDDGFDIVILDVRMPDITGIDVLRKIRRRNREIIVIIITAYGSVENALKACRLGADDYLTKPFSREQLLFVIEKANRFRKLQTENIELQQELVDKHKFGNFIARSAQMEELIKMAAQGAGSDATILIHGASGTGKEVLARAIHYNSPRKDKPFITVNCPSIPDNLLESELFGHVKGAFTGAIESRKGKFERADGGTIFLDEIGDLHEDLQAKLLRVLQEMEFEPVGGSKSISVDVRVIAATNKNIEELMKSGKFRDDLYYRLSVFPLTIPPLREHKEDIPHFVDLFIQRYGKGEQHEIDPEVIQVLQEYHWPGNVRELENSIERALILSTNKKITLDHLPPYLLKKEEVEKVKEENDDPLTDRNDLTLETIERNVVSEALRRSEGNRSHAARLLKIPRHVLLYRMKKLGLE